MVQPNQFVFGGESSLDYGLYITESGVFGAPERSITEQNVPGRNGAILIDDGYYKPRAVKYKVWLDSPAASDRAALSRRVAAWLLSNPGEYRELYDSYDPDYCKIAYYSGGIDMDASDAPILQQTLAFSCKPYQYLRSSLRLRQLVNGETLVNPHRFPAAPYIKITGSGDITLSVGNNSWLLSGVDGYIELDSERMSTYKGTQLLNDHKSGTGYPTLAVGHTGIRWSGGTVQKIEIMPRWCTL